MGLRTLLFLTLTERLFGLHTGVLRALDFGVSKQ
jgi:hypothetical protein